MECTLAISAMNVDIGKGFLLVIVMISPSLYQPYHKTTSLKKLVFPPPPQLHVCGLVTNELFCGCAEPACSKFRTANQITGSLQVTTL